MYIQLEEINKLDKQFYEQADTLLRFTDNAYEYYLKGSVKEQPVPEYLTTSFGILGQLDKNF